MIRKIMMSSIFLSLFLLLVLFFTTTKSFVISDWVSTVLPKSILGHTRPVRELNEFTEAQIGSIFTIRLNIHEVSNDEHVKTGLHLHQPNDPPVIGMSVDGLSFKMGQALEFGDINNSNRRMSGDSYKGVDKSGRILLPGSDGPYPAISSGPHKLHVLQPGCFVDLSGLIRLPIAIDAPIIGMEPTATAGVPGTALWELVWRENALGGYLICAVEMGHSVCRSSNKMATLPAGTVYMSFALWKRDILIDYQQRKKTVLDQAAMHLRIRDEELTKMQQTNNVIQKALHYRNAAAAVERYSLYPVQSMSQYVPNDAEILQISEDLFVAKEGTVWTKNNSPISSSKLLEMAFQGPMMKKTLLGTAVIRQRTQSS